MLLAEHATLQPNMSRLLAQRLARLDLCYGIAAGIVLITGALRFVYFGKDMSYYLDHPLFYIKVGLFLLIALISIYPTITILSWRRAWDQNSCAEITPHSIRRIQYLIRLELVLLIVTPLFAVLIARGIGA